MRKARGQTSSSYFLFPFHFFLLFSQGLSSVRLFKEPLREVRWELHDKVSFPLSVTQLVLTLGVGQRGARPSGESLLSHSAYTAVHLKLLHKFGKEYCTQKMIHCFNCS